MLVFLIAIPSSKLISFVLLQITQVRILWQQRRLWHLFLSAVWTSRSPKSSYDVNSRYALIHQYFLLNRECQVYLFVFFQKFGPIEHVRVVRDQNGKSRGYAFIQFERESDIPVCSLFFLCCYPVSYGFVSLQNAYDGARGMTINGRKIIVDVERGRTVRNWLPKRLGGGLGHTRPAHPPKKRDTKAEHVYPPIGSFAVIIPPSLEESTSRKAVTERALNIRREITRILSGRVASTPAVPARGIEETQHRGRDRSRSRERYI